MRKFFFLFNEILVWKRNTIPFLGSLPLMVCFFRQNYILLRRVPLFRAFKTKLPILNRGSEKKGIDSPVNRITTLVFSLLLALRPFFLYLPSSKQKAKKKKRNHGPCLKSKDSKVEHRNKKKLVSSAAKLLYILGRRISHLLSSF